MVRSATAGMVMNGPPLWRRVTDWRVRDHWGGDITLAALKPGAAAGTCP